MLYNFLKIKWSHLLTLTITNDKLTDDNELLCNDFKIKKFVKKSIKLHIGMAIFARPTGTRPGPTLMDRVLPNPIRNRVRYGFFKKKKPKRVQVLSKNLKPDLKLGSDITRLP